MVKRDCAGNYMEEAKKEGIIVKAGVDDGRSRSRMKTNDSLLPALINDVALNCLSWDSRSDYGSLPCINTRFNKLIKSGALYELRRQLDVAEHWVYLVCDPRGWEAFDPNRNKWMTLPRIPSDECFNHADKESLAVGSELLVFDGEFLDFVIWKYSLVSCNWVKCEDMHHKRCLFGSGSLGSIAIIAGETDQKGDMGILSSMTASTMGKARLHLASFII